MLFCRVRTFSCTILLFVACLDVVYAQVLPAFGDSRTGTTGFQFLKIAPDARASGMGGSVIATVDDASALYWNPAGMTKVDTQKIHLQLGHTEYFAGIGFEYLGMVNRLSETTFLGLSLYGMNSGDMPVTTEFHPFGTGQTFRALDMAAALSLGRVLTDNFSFGITTKFIRESIADIHTHAFVFDFGFQYDVGLRDTRFAVNVSNFGFNAQPQGSLPVLRLDGGDTIVEFEKIAIPAVFALGFAWDAVKQEDHLLTLATQLNHPTDNNETIGFGAEYSWRSLLYVRTGYQFGVDEKGAPAFGFGLRLKRNFGILNFDYGFNHKSRLGGIHRITVGMSIL